MDAFARFAIDHLSPSSLNLWKEAPGIWALRYLKRVRDEGGAGFWRGTATENGLSVLLRTKDVNEALEAAHSSFDMNTAGEISEDIEAERALIEPMVRELIRWAPPSDLMASQIKIEHWFDGIPVPVIGYLDFAFECRDVDLKTTKACPSSPRPDHIRQVSLYRAARNRPGGLLYVTGKKHAYFEVDDAQMSQAMADLEEDANRLFNFLSRMNNADDALMCLPVNKDHWQFPKSRPASLVISPVSNTGSPIMAETRGEVGREQTNNLTAG
jgi:hypothetical protein